MKPIQPINSSPRNSEDILNCDAKADRLDAEEMELPGFAGFVGAKLVSVGIVCIFALVVSGHMMGCYVQDMLQLRQAACETVMLDGMMLIVLLVYMLLIATPFVPGAEIGLALLLIFGVQFAGVLYLATVAALMLSFSIGRLAPSCLLETLFARLGFTRIALLLSKNHAGTCSIPVSSARALSLPNWINWLLRHKRYTLAVLINAPGNTLVGGGGGIALAAGVSRQITFCDFLISVSLAVAPVPLIVMFVAWIGV